MPGDDKRYPKNKRCCSFRINRDFMNIVKSTITDEQFVKVRCSLDSKTHYFDATGSMYAQPLDNKEAPTCRLKRSIATSWSRFEEEFDAYLRGEEFPPLAPIKDEHCLE